MEKLVQRLRIEKEEASEWSYQKGGEDGQKWALEDATYSELVDWSSPEYLANSFNEMPFPESEAAVEWRQAALDMAREIGEFFDDDSYARGFLEAVRHVWEEVKDRV